MMIAISESRKERRKKKPAKIVSFDADDTCSSRGTSSPALSIASPTPVTTVASLPSTTAPAGIQSSFYMFDMDPVNDSSSHHDHHHLHRSDAAVAVDTITRVKSTGCLERINNPDSDKLPDKQQTSLRNLTTVGAVSASVGSRKKTTDSLQNVAGSTSAEVVVDRSSCGVSSSSDKSSRVKMFMTDSCSETSLLDCVECNNHNSAMFNAVEKDAKSTHHLPISLIKAEIIHQSASACSFDSAMRYRLLLILKSNINVLCEPHSNPRLPLTQARSLAYWEFS